jgi:PAS domain S-box-containing protein
MNPSIENCPRQNPKKTIYDSIGFHQIKQHLSIIFETSADGIWICSGEGKILALSKTSERLNGVKSEEVIGKDVAMMVENNIVDTNITPEVIKTRQTVSKMQFVKRTGRHLMVTGSPAFDDNGNIEFVVVNERDTTELNLLQRELKKTQLEKQQILEQLKSISFAEGAGQNIVADSPAISKAFQTAVKLSQHEVSNILILGETGVGKGLMCDYIQRNSPRNKRPFIKINCAALPESLLEAELFGYESGAFTGANKKGKPGLFELADKGILFLDEIGDMPLPIQSKLLKYFDDNEVMRLGGTRSKKIDCLIIAATNKDLKQQVRKKLFRRDLFHRINRFVIQVPPLRERPDDILPLTSLFMDRCRKRYHIQRKIHHHGINALQSHPFPGNIRELKNLVEEASLLSDKTKIDRYIIDKLRRKQPQLKTDTTPQKVAEKKESDLKKQINAFERKIISETAVQCHSTSELAKKLKISQASASRKMKKFGLTFRQSAGMSGR